MGLSYLTLDGVSSKDFGVVLSGAGTYSAPARSYEAVSVPGKNGDVLFDNGKYENIVVQYEAGIAHNMARLDAFRGWLLSHTDYCRLEDTYHPGEYRMGMPVSGLVPSVTAMLRIARFTLYFNCKPQRFLKSGEQPITLTANASLKNDTFYAAKPLIRVYGYGALGVGSETVTIASHPLAYIDLDCDIEDASCAGTNANRYVTLSGDSYPKLAAGTTGITLGGHITRVDITPRWWTL